MAYKYTLETFNNVRDFLKENNIRRHIELKKCIKDGNFPKDLPSAYRLYPIKFKEFFISWKHFYGTDINYFTLCEVKELCKPYDFKSVKEFLESDLFIKYDRMVPNYSFKEYYKDEWISWGDLFSNDFVSPSESIYISYHELKSIVNDVGIKSALEWDIYYNKIIRADEELFNSKYERVPINPQVFYKEWTSWGDFLSTGRVANTKKVFLPYEEAREYVRDVLKINKSYDYKVLIRLNKLPKFLPKSPTYYPECKGWADWFYKT